MLIAAIIWKRISSNSRLIAKAKLPEICRQDCRSLEIWRIISVVDMYLIFFSSPSMRVQDHATRCVLLHANVDHSQRFTLIHFSTLKFSFIGCLTISFLTGLVGEGVPASQKFTKRVIDAGSLSLMHVLGLVS